MAELGFACQRTYPYGYVSIIRNDMATELETWKIRPDGCGGIYIWLGNSLLFNGCLRDDSFFVTLLDGVGYEPKRVHYLLPAGPLNNAPSAP